MGSLTDFNTDERDHHTILAALPDAIGGGPHVVVTSGSGPIPLVRKARRVLPGASEGTNRGDVQIETGRSAVFHAGQGVIPSQLRSHVFHVLSMLGVIEDTIGFNSHRRPALFDLEACRLNRPDRIFRKNMRAPLSIPMIAKDT